MNHEHAFCVALCRRGKLGLVTHCETFYDHDRQMHRTRYHGLMMHGISGKKWQSVQPTFLTAVQVQDLIHETGGVS